MGRKPHIVKDTKMRALMEAQGLNRKQLMARINGLFPDAPISPDALSRIANGERTDYSLATLYRICKGLGVTPNDLLDWEEHLPALVIQSEPPVHE